MVFTSFSSVYLSPTFAESNFAESVTKFNTMFVPNYIKIIMQTCVAKKIENLLVTSDI